MPALKELTIPQFVNSSDNDLIQDFFHPVLCASNRYDRGVGYFSSGWLRFNAEGLVRFAERNGKARWVTSPILSKQDWEALKKGDEAKANSILRAALQKAISDLRRSLEQDTLSAFAWLVADGILEFKLAVLRGKLDGEFHDKFGIFTDPDGNRLSFSGSYNESIQGLHNYESFKVFKSWIPEQQEWIKADAERFEKLWNNDDPNVRVLDIGESNREKILKLRSTERPYKQSLESTATIQEPEEMKLRGYQETAIAKWFENGCKGFFEMATGTGKTIAALASAKRLLERDGRLGIIVTVPYQHLVDQWKREALKFGFHPILAYKSKNTWLDKLNKQILDFNNGHRHNFMAITSNATFKGKPFQETINRLKGTTLLIADEAHHLGSETAVKAFPEHVLYRLALSATPNRWFDEKGTKDLREFFGDTVFEFPLAEAIGKYLTPYYYYPVIVELTEYEMKKYAELSLQITRLIDKLGTSNHDKVQRLLEIRADLLNQAENKLDKLSKLVDQNVPEEFALFYCAPGQINAVTALLGNEKGLLVHPFTYHEDNNQRQQLLDDFGTGKLQGLTAIRCLDEGVDVPNTRTAFILASSSNPREFIQRRGRILRKAEGKEYSVIYDLITVPPLDNAIDEEKSQFRMERNIMRKELGRFREFAALSKNKHQAIDKIWEVADRYHLTDF